MIFEEGITAILVTRTITGVDGDGNTTYADTPVLWEGCAFDPGGSSELVQGQDTVIRNPTLYGPDGATVPAPVDAVVIGGSIIDGQVVGGDRYNVDGQPEQYDNPFTGWTPGPVVRLERVTG